MRPTTKAKAKAAAKVAVNVAPRTTAGFGAAALEAMRAADVLRRRVRLEEGVVAHLRRERRLRRRLAVEVEAAHVGAVDQHRRAGVQRRSAGVQPRRARRELYSRGL